MTTTTRLTIPELLERHPDDVMALSPQQRVFAIEYIAGGLANGRYDARSAAAIAYPHVKEIGVWANRLLVNKRVKRIIGLHHGLSEAAVLLADVRNLIKKSRRSGANHDVLVAPCLQAAAALKAYVAKEKKS
jgi:hypothetical protein